MLYRRDYPEEDFGEHVFPNRKKISAHELESRYSRSSNLVQAYLFLLALLLSKPTWFSSRVSLEDARIDVLALQYYN